MGEGVCTLLMESRPEQVWDLMKSFATDAVTQHHRGLKLTGLRLTGMTSVHENTRLVVIPCRNITTKAIVLIVNKSIVLIIWRALVPWEICIMNIMVEILSIILFFLSDRLP